MAEGRERSVYAQQIIDRHSADHYPDPPQNAFVEAIEKYQMMVIKMAERAMELEGIPSDIRKRVIDRILLGKPTD